VAIAKERLTKRKELKFRRSDLKDIENAASISGFNGSAFIRAAAIEKAHKILESERVSALGTEDWNTFTATVTTYTEPPNELKKNMAKFLNSYKRDIWVNLYNNPKTLR